MQIIKIVFDFTVVFRNLLKELCDLAFFLNVLRILNIKVENCPNIIFIKFLLEYVLSIHCHHWDIQMYNFDLMQYLMYLVPYNVLITNKVLSTSFTNESFKYPLCLILQFLWRRVESAILVLKILLYLLLKSNLEPFWNVC